MATVLDGLNGWHAGYKYAADFWSLGILVYFLLHGEVPPKVGQYVDSSALQASPKLSLAAVDFLRQCCQPDPTLRLGAHPGDVVQIKAHSFFKVCACLHVHLLLCRPWLSDACAGSHC